MRIGTLLAAAALIAPVIAWPFEEVCGGRIDGFPYGTTG